MTDEESEALYEFSKALLEDRKWTLERGFNSYTQDWLDHYMKLKGERLACKGK